MSEPPAVPDRPDRPHRDDGLDLARAAARAAAGSRWPAGRPGARGLAGRRRTPGRPTPGPQLSGAHPDERDPQLLGSQVDRLVDEQGWELELRVRGVFARWPELVGGEVAAHCTPESFGEGRLVVRTDSTAWATQLRLLSPTVLRRLNEDLGHGTVTVLEVLGPRLPGVRRGRLRTRDSKGPGDTYG